MSGRSPQQALEHMAREALAAKFPEGVPDKYAQLLEHELRLVAKMAYAALLPDRKFDRRFRAQPGDFVPGARQRG